MSDSPEDLSDIERRLRAASATSFTQLDARPAETEKLINRARRETGLRDVVTFGFTHLLGGFLRLIATLAHRRLPPGPEEK
jgi:hypothetical protein